MIIELPDSEIGKLHLTSEQARVELAVGLYAGKQVSMGRAARIAGIPYTSFMKEIGRRGICLNYSVEDAEHDMQMVDLLCKETPKA